MEHHRKGHRCEIDREGGEKMTRKEKVAEEKPAAVNELYVGGVRFCPSKYIFLKLPNVNSYNDCDGDCDECWNTEWSEPTCPQWQQNILDKFMRVI